MPVVFEHYYLACIAHGSYLIGDGGNAYIIDPRRDVDMYVEELARHELTLKGVLLTHLHADFVSGHVELGSAMDAPVYIGSSAPELSFPHERLSDGQCLRLSECASIKVMETPGHTPESVCYVLMEKHVTGAEEAWKPTKIFTGDTLFVGSTGRPDLLGALGASEDELASMLYASLGRIMELPDDVEVYPAHGPGSPCGKSLGGALSSTIGKERETNVALQMKTETEFIKHVTSNQPHAPQYFLNAALSNRELVAPVRDACACELFKPDAFHKLLEEKDPHTGKPRHVLIDTRTADEFADGHIRGALNFSQGTRGGESLGPEDGTFAIWIGTLIPPDAHVLIVSTDDEGVQETSLRLGRIGYDSVVSGGLQGGMDAWRAAALEVLEDARVVVSPTHAEAEDHVEEHEDEVWKQLTAQGGVLVDVRTPGEFHFNHVEGAINAPLHTLEKTLEEGKLFSPDNSYVVYCVSGFRSAIAKSLMLRAGLSCTDVKMGFVALWGRFPHRCLQSAYRCPKGKAALEAASAARS